MAEVPESALAVEGDPEAVLARTNLPDEVQAALRALPDDYRAAIVLCDVLGYDYAEIARQLDVPDRHRPQPHPSRPGPAAEGAGADDRHAARRRAASRRGAVGARRRQPRS